MQMAAQEKVQGWSVNVNPMRSSAPFRPLGTTEDAEGTRELLYVGETDTPLGYRAAILVDGLTITKKLERPL